MGGCFRRFWGYGWFYLKGLEKPVRFIYQTLKNHGKLPRNGNFRFWISIYFQRGEGIAFGALYGLWGPYMASLEPT